MGAIMTKNTSVTFFYRDGDNYKFRTPTYILSGELDSHQMNTLRGLFSSVTNLLVPSQIDENFANACPLRRGHDYKTSNTFDWNNEADHSYHTMLVEYTDEESNFKMSIEEFYERCVDTDGTAAGFNEILD